MCLDQFMAEHANRSGVLLGVASAPAPFMNMMNCQDIAWGWLCWVFLAFAFRVKACPVVPFVDISL